MNQPAMPPARRRRQARLMRVANVPMRRLLRLPFRTPLSGRLMLLTFTGRKTGRVYRQPVSYVPDGDTLLTPAGGRWKLNLREGQAIQVRLRGREVLARPEFIRDVDQVERLLHTITAANPRAASFIPVIGRAGQIDRDRLQAAVDYGFAIIRWHIDQAPSRRRS